MPLFEPFGTAKGKPRATHENPTPISADQSFPPENELAELVWQNGQVMMQGPSSRAKKDHFTCNSCGLPPYSLHSHSPKRDKGLSSGLQSSPSLKFRTLQSGMNEFLMSSSLGEMGLNSDDDIVPWLDYPIDETPQNDFCMSFMPELSGISASEPSQKDFNTMKRGGCTNDVYGNSSINSIYLGLDHENSSKSSALAMVSEPMKTRTSHNPAGQLQFLSPRPRQVCENTGTSTSNHCVSRDLSQLTNSAAGFSSKELRKQNPGPSTNCDNLRNFSHFLRPAALYKSNIGNNCEIADLGPSNLERAGSKQKDSSSDVKTVRSNSGPMRELRPYSHIAEKQATDTSLEATPTRDLSFKESKGIRKEYAAKGDTQNNESGGARTCREPQDAIEPAVASSVCSGNGVNSVSDDPPSNLKRKACSSNHDSEAPSEDVEEDSVSLRKPVSARGGGSKRSRAAEVHNLSERRRRDRINEKMRALQELIPNSNKVDKASMLDEAIDYLKTLQLQVQIMSMGAGLCMPSMMLPSHMAQFSPMSAGMATGLGFRMGVVSQNGGPTACPMLQVPPMQGAHFPSPVMSGHQALHGMLASNCPVMGLPSQGIPMPHLPTLIPFPGGLSLRPPAGSNTNTQTGLNENTDAAFASRSREVAKSISDTSCPINHISSQSQASNGGFEQPEGYAVTSATAKRDETDPSKVS